MLKDIDSLVTIHGQKLNECHILVRTESERPKGASGFKGFSIAILMYHTKGSSGYSIMIPVKSDRTHKMLARNIERKRAFRLNKTTSCSCESVSSPNDTTINLVTIVVILNSEDMVIAVNIQYKTICCFTLSFDISSLISVKSDLTTSFYLTDMYYILK